MYSNGEGLGTPIGKTRQKRARAGWDEGKKPVMGKGRMVQCLCPRCRKTFMTTMMWSGRGMPRKYCADCKVIISNYDEMVTFEYHHSISVPAKKRGRSAAEE